MIPLRMAAYCRVSTQKQTQLDSLAHQRLFFASYARSNQLHLTHIYADAPDIIGLKQNPTKRASL